MSHVEKVLYIYLKSDYNRGNNGDIPFHYRKYEGEFSSATIAKVLGSPKREGTLIKKGWLERRMVGGRYRYEVRYRLTGKYDILR